MENFPTRFRESRISAGLTQQNITDILKIPTRTQQHWESGERLPPEYVQLLVLDRLQSLIPAKITPPTIQ